MFRSVSVISKGLLILIPFIGAFLFLLFLNPYYFLQDDNYSQFYPVLANGLENFYAGKGFPTFCLYPYSGLPTVSYSTYPFFYPLLHLSHGVSHFILQNDFHLLTVYTGIHFGLGYFFVVRIFRLQSISLLGAMIGALLFVFCGFNLIATRSWYYVSPTIAFLPMVFYCLMYWKDGRFTWVRFSLLSGLLTLYVYSGNFQFWCYTVLFVLIYFIWKKGKSKGYYFLILGSIVFSILIFLPQALATYSETNAVHRSDPYGWGILHSLLPLLGLPFHGAIPNGWGSPTLRDTDAQFYHGGGLLILLALFFVAFQVVKSRGKWSALLLHSPNGLLLCFIMALLFSLGRSGGLWILHSSLPVISSFAHPFKFLVYVQFFGILIGLRYWYVLTRKKIMIRGVLLCFLLLYFCWHLVNTRQAFYLYSYSVPYSRPVWESHIPLSFQGRIAPINLGRSEVPGFDQALGLNFCVPYKRLSIEGYENLNTRLPDFHQHHREFGVGYFLLYKHGGDSVAWNIVTKEFARYKTSADTVFEDQDFLLLKNDTCSGMVEFYDAKQHAVASEYSLHERADGFDVMLKSVPADLHSVMINFVWRPAFKVYAERKELPVSQDAYGRMKVELKSPITKLEIRYEPF